LRSERRLFAALGALVLISACEIEKVGIAQTDALVSMHGVLSATATTQVVLLERTRNGSIQLVAPPFDLADPVVSDEGVAETGAQVSLVTPAGQTVFALEDNTTRDDRKGGGIYRFSLPGSALVRGGTYRLSVRTSKGEVLTAETSVPGGASANVAEARTFDRSRDTLSLRWDAVPGARSYLVRVETPFGPRSFFTDSTRTRLTGELRNADLRTLPHVFIPGFPQAVTVSAVDSNFYDWYRTQNDPLTGSGLVNRVRGGFGMFGSLVRLRFDDLTVIAPQPEQASGHFIFTGSNTERSFTPYLSFDLYVESPAARGDQADALSGRYNVRPRLDYSGCLVCGLLGNTKGGHIDLYFVKDWSAADTVERLSGEIRGDTIVGSYRGFGGIARFVRQR
jgi:hypothetical protein